MLEKLWLGEYRRNSLAITGGYKEETMLGENDEWRKLYFLLRKGEK